ncbi:hypothetical protein [uncultured Friedmanniella sp.]|uniref:hypothetical protein n=1 Tax=uncultured Friedmanniella sp. TaxID=335381 RepID=UPI0035CB17A2
MTSTPSPHRRADPPAHQLRLLANLGPAATVVLGSLTVWLVVATLQNLAQPMSSAVVASLLVNTVATVLAGLATYRLGVEAPRFVRGWQAALVERNDVLRHR